MPKKRFGQVSLFLVFLSQGTAVVRSDDTLYRYEGNVFPYDASEGWLVFNSCDLPCSESLDQGHFKLSWPQAADTANYHRWITLSPAPPLPSLWVEWRFRSNHPAGQFFFNCDAELFLRYKSVSDGLNMYSNRAYSQDGNFAINLPGTQFYTYRFESLDGMNYRFSANGDVFVVRTMNGNPGSNYIQLVGRGGCGSDQIPDMVNEWDFVRYGTIGSGEQVVSTTPVSGALGPSGYTSFTSFLVTFDQPNYVYVDDISVSVTGGIAPVVTATRRTDTHDEHTVEIALDRPLPPNQLTTFTLTDGQQSTNIHYDFRTVPAAIPTAGTSGLITLVVVLTLAAGFIIRNLADVTAP